MSAEAAAILQSIQGTPVPLQGVSARGRLNGLLFEHRSVEALAQRAQQIQVFPDRHRHAAVAQALEEIEEHRGSPCSGAP